MIRPTTIALAAIVAATAASAQTAGDITVVDGDTVKVRGAPWRLQGFDTPETFYARCDAERRLGDLATRELARLIAAAKRVAPVAAGGVDRYGRTLGRLYLDGQNVGPLLIGKGLAVAYTGRGPRRDWCTR